MKTTFGAVLNSLMFFVEAGRHQHLAMQNQFICDLSKGQNSFGIVLNIWVAGCLGGGTGKLAANDRYCFAVVELAAQLIPKEQKMP